MSEFGILYPGRNCFFPHAEYYANCCGSECLSILQGHTSLVGQLQMRGDTLVTGGSDGSVRVWSLETMAPIHRLAAHDNSVTSLQFDDTRIVSGGSDGRVKIWDLKTGHLVRELLSQAEAVWRVAFEDEKCVALALRSSRTVMEVRMPLKALPRVPITDCCRCGHLLRQMTFSTIVTLSFNNECSKTTQTGH